MLKNGGQNHDGLATGAGYKRTGGAHPEVGSAGYNVVDCVHIGAALQNLDLQPGITIEALLKGRVVACKLELVVPFELQCRDVECLRV